MSPEDCVNPTDLSSELRGSEVLVAVSGGIAAYKVATVVSGLVQRGAGVTVAMTAAAQRFVTPLTFEAISQRRVFTSLWDSGNHHDSQHLSLTAAADIFIIAPATANIIGKSACGIADDLVSTMVLSADSPILLAPAMNTRMWENTAVRNNMRTLEQRGFEVIPPEEGWLACGAVGAGRMAEPQAILAAATAILKRKPPKCLEKKSSSSE
ncbi:MAG: flavoprotein [Planctomycetota bacterium]